MTFSIADTAVKDPIDTGAVTLLVTHTLPTTNVFTPVHVTTAVNEDGSLSGIRAPTRCFCPAGDAAQRKCVRISASSGMSSVSTRDVSISSVAFAVSCSGGCCANAYHATGSVKGVYEDGCKLFRKRMECAIMVAVDRALRD